MITTKTIQQSDPWGWTVEERGFRPRSSYSLRGSCDVSLLSNVELRCELVRTKLYCNRKDRYVSGVQPTVTQIRILNAVSLLLLTSDASPTQWLCR